MSLLFLATPSRLLVILQFLDLPWFPTLNYHLHYFSSTTFSTKSQKEGPNRPWLQPINFSPSQSSLGVVSVVDISIGASAIIFAGASPGVVDVVFVASSSCFVATNYWPYSPNQGPNSSTAAIVP